MISRFYIRLLTVSCRLSGASAESGRVLPALVPGERRAVAAAESRSLAGDTREARETAATRRAKMVKSLSQDTGCSLPQEAVTLATSAR